MKDTAIIRMAEETSNVLSDAHGFQSSPYLGPTYNAMLAAGKANHPEDPFLSTLPHINPGEDNITISELRALLAQLRIALESLQDET